jgi:hypothetical protein
MNKYKEFLEEIEKEYIEWSNADQAANTPNLLRKIGKILHEVKRYEDNVRYYSGGA